MHCRNSCLFAVVLAVCAIAQAKVTVQIDYSLDTNGFFSSAGNPTNWAAARAAVEYAAQTFSDRLRDNLTEVASVPGFSGGTWTPKITHPATGTSGYSLPTTTVIPANKVVIYVGGRAIGGSTLGIGGPGGYGVSYYSVDWYNNVRARGQTGALDATPTDFGTWGGSLSFNSSSTWNYSLTGPAAGKNDFFSVALHELGHALGFGTAASFDALVPGSTFDGAKAAALYGAGVPIYTGDYAHYNTTVNSTVAGVTQQTAMSPSITTGTRKKFTLLDWAAMDDLGWLLALPGDADANGTIGFDDLVAVAQNYEVAGGLATWAQGDFNYNGIVNFDDLVYIAQGYETTDPEGAALPAGVNADFAADWAAAQALVATVPEPTLLGPLGLVLLALGRRRRS